MADNRPNTYDENGVTVYRASSFGGCTKMLAALRMGYESAPTPPATLETYEEGNKAEIVALNRLVREPYNLHISEMQREYDLQLMPKVVIRSHIDGMTTEDARVLEIKSQGQDQWDHFDKHGWESLLWPKYRWQMSAVMHATHRPALVVRINRSDPECPLDLIEVDQPFHTMAELRARHIKVERVVRAGVLPEECDWLSYPCPVYRLHSGTLDLAVPMMDPEIDTYAREYDKARSEEKRWAGIKDTAKRALRLGIVEDKVRTNSGIVVSFTQAKTRRFSEKLMKDRGLDPEELKEETVTERIDVRVPDDPSSE